MHQSLNEVVDVRAAEDWILFEAGSHTVRIDNSGNSTKNQSFVKASCSPGFKVDASVLCSFEVVKLRMFEEDLMIETPDKDGNSYEIRGNDSTEEAQEQPPSATSRRTFQFGGLKIGKYSINTFG